MQRTLVILSLFVVHFGEGIVVSSLQQVTPVGATSLVLDSYDGFVAGHTIKMASGTPREETNVIASIGASMILKNPLLHQQPIATLVEELPQPVTTTVAAAAVVVTTPQAATTAATTALAATTAQVVTTPQAATTAATTALAATTAQVVTTPQTATTAATTALAATTAQVVTTTRFANIYAVTSLITYASAGGHRVFMANTAGFVEHMDITIDPGAANEETVRIVGFKDSAIFNVLVFPPLTWGHSVNAIVQAAGPWAKTSTYTPAPPLVAKNAVGEVQQKLAGVPNPFLVIGLFVSAAIIAVVFRAGRHNSRQSRESQVLEPSDSECALE